MTTRSPIDYPAAPRLTRVVLALRVPRGEREFVKGDLAEGFAAARAAHGTWRARLWYARQLVSLLGVPWRREGSPRQREMEKPIHAIASDVRFALRSLRRAPLFSALVVLTFAIGIGATSAVFSVVYPVVLAQPPYPRPDRLVMIWERDPSGDKNRVGFLTVDDIRRETRVLASAAMIGSWTPVVRAGDDARRVIGARVSWNYFSTLGVRPALGRDFAPDDDTPVTRQVAMLGHRLWITQFGGDSSVVGTTASINDVEYVIAGVMPAEFQNLLSPEVEIWSPLGYAPETSSACRTCRHLRAVARLRDGVSLDAATHELDGFLRTLRERHPDEYGSVGAHVTPLQEELAGDYRAPLLGVFGAVALLLLLACANVANLFLGRASERHTDLAIRLALGAKRSRLVRMVSLEAGLLALIGGGLGVALAWRGSAALVSAMSVPAAIASRVEMAAPVVLCALALTAVCAIVSAALPAFLALGESSLADIRAGARGVLGRARHRMRSAVVIAEVALAVLLLAGAGLQVRSLREALAVRTGFDPNEVLTMEVTLRGQQYATDGASRNFYRRLIEEARGIPGLHGAAVVSQLPLGGNFDGFGVHREDKPAENPSDDPGAQRFAISPAYLDVMRIAVLRGRGLTPADREGAEFVMLINRSGAERIYGSDDPLGKRVRIAGNDGPWRTIVGIVDDVRHLSLEGEPENQIYIPFDQHPWEELDLAVVARANGDAASLTQPMTQLAKRLDAGVALSRVRPMDAVIGEVASSRRLALSLVGGFAIIAVVLALGGLYGVMTASVAERVREIGLRSALGATPGRLVQHVLTRGLLLTAIGIAIGISGLIAARGVVQRFVYGVSAGDPVTLASVVVLLAVVAIVACIVPAARAARIDPIVAMREC